MLLFLGRKLSAGEALTGTGRLTWARINTIQNFFWRAIRDNRGDAKEMARSTRAILKHYDSTVEEPKHDDSPAGASSWCSFQRDIPMAPTVTSLSKIRSLVLLWR